jgi:hypothetical protein
VPHGERGVEDQGLTRANAQPARTACRG